MFNKVLKEELKVLATNDSLKELRNFVTKIGKKYRFSDKVVNAFKLAIDEACTNIIRHSYRDITGFITIRAVIRNESLTICLIDQGRYFDPTSVKDPDLKRYVAIGKKGGLGIFMIRKLVDEITYHKTDEGNELRLTKKKDVERKRKFLLSGVPGSMRTKYYLFSVIIVSVVVLVMYTYNFINTDNEILDTEFQNMHTISDLLATPAAEGIIYDYTENKFFQTVSDVLEPYSDYIAFGVVTEMDNMIKASSNIWTFPTYNIFNSGDSLNTFPEGIKLVKKSVIDSNNIMSEKQYFLVHNPALSPEGTQKGNSYLFVPAKPIFESISQKRISDLKLALLILLLANVGVGLLIFLIFIPLQKLSNWVRDMGQEDIRDKIDIDTSNEIGKIAHAFGEITDKFRESQKSLADQERIQQEMHLAQEIQQTLLPAEFPDIPGYEIASHYESAKEVGGDYYDFVDVDRDRMGVVVADVSGKGVPGSLVMTMIRTALRTEARGISSAAEVLSKVNNFVIGDIRKGMFVTLFYTILDARRRRVTFASAGHNPMILYRANTKKTYYLNPKGFPVGISLNEGDLFKRSIEDDTIQLSKGDIIICYTDGITEAMNSKRELFGEERLLEVIRQYGHLRAKQFVEQLKEELNAFTEGQIQYDDITFVVIKEKMSPEESDFERAKEIYYGILNGISKTDACIKHGMPISTFTQKYQEKLEKQGVEKFRKEFETTSIECGHISVEEQTKIYDIIRQHPEWGAKRISTQLNTEEYGNTDIPEKRIYEELVRKRLNTRALREAYVSRGINKTRMKPPGTPMLTLDGQVILDDHLGPKLHAPLIIDPEISEVDAFGEKNEEPGTFAKKPIDEREGSELILSDLVDLLDKGNESIKKDEEKTVGVGEDLKDSISEEEDRKNVENKSEITNLLENILESDSEDLEEKEVDFSDLSASDYSVEQFKDRTNGDEDEEELITKAEGIHREKSKAKDKDKKSPDKIFDDLTVELEENSYNEAELEDFDQFIVDEKNIEDEYSLDDEKISTEQKDYSSIEAEKVEILDRSTVSLDGSELVSIEELESRQVNEIIDDLSVNVREESDEAVYFSDESADTNVDEFFDLVSNEEMSLADEISKANEPAQKSSIKKKESKKQNEKGSIEYQQRLLVAGGHYYMQKKYDKAIQIFQRLINKFPNNIEAHYNLGNSYFRLKKYDDAQTAYEIVCDLDPTFLDAMENLGVIFANKNEYKEAIKSWKKILEFDPKREDIKENIEKALKISRNK